MKQRGETRAKSRGIRIGGIEGRAVEEATKQRHDAVRDGFHVDIGSECAVALSLVDRRDDVARTLIEEIEQEAVEPRAGALIPGHDTPGLVVHGHTRSHRLEHPGHAFENPVQIRDGTDRPGVGDGFENPQRLLVGVDHRCEEEVMLALEEIVERALRDLGQRRHLIHARALDAAATAYLVGRIEDATQLAVRSGIGSARGHGASKEKY